MEEEDFELAGEEGGELEWSAGNEAICPKVIESWEYPRGVVCCCCFRNTNTEEYK